MYNKVVGKNILIFGDLHISDVYKGRHKDYLVNCFSVLSQIDEMIQEVNPCAIFFLGDLIGQNETNIKNREVLTWVCKYFTKWNKTAVVYSVRGNHDMKGYPDFQFLLELDLIKTSTNGVSYVDYFGTAEQTAPEIRFHLVDYGREDEPLNLHTNGSTTNIVLGHNDFQISGVTTWYKSKGGLELGRHSNFNGVDYVISGHIHNPSPEIYSVLMPDSEECNLFYPGCPTRPVKEQNLYDSVWVPFFVYDVESSSTNMDMRSFVLADKSELFYEDDTFIEEYTEDELQNQIRLKELENVLNDLLKYRMTGGDPIEQIKTLPNASDAAKEVAISYLTKALS